MGDRTVGVTGLWVPVAAKITRWSLSGIFALAVLFGAAPMVSAEPIGEPAQEESPTENALDATPLDHLGVLEGTDSTTMTLEEMEELDQQGERLSLIPEPATLVMLGLAALLLFIWRRKW